MRDTSFKAWQQVATRVLFSALGLFVVMLVCGCDEDSDTEFYLTPKGFAYSFFEPETKRGANPPLDLDYLVKELDDGIVAWAESRAATTWWTRDELIGICGPTHMKFYFVDAEAWYNPRTGQWVAGLYYQYGGLREIKLATNVPNFRDILFWELDHILGK